jgi:hypothetical protein
VRLHLFLLSFAFCLSTGAIGAQSLTEVAKKEKERRKKNQEKGEQVLVITETELQQGKSESTAPEESSADEPTSARPASTARSSSPSTNQGYGDEEGGGPPPTEIPNNAPMRDRIAIFEQMLNAYRQKVRAIDTEIAQNNKRIAEIQQQLSTMGAGGLPVAPEVDRNPRNPGQLPELQAEQNELRQKNQQLEASKKQLANELREKGRRAGIPSGYLRNLP